MTKKELRAAMRRKNLGITPSERAAASGRIFARTELSEAFGRARTVGVFCSLADEPDTSEALARWSAAGRRLAVPRVEGDVMRFYEYDPRTMRPGALSVSLACVPLRQPGQAPAAAANQKIPGLYARESFSRIYLYSSTSRVRCS